MRLPRHVAEVGVPSAPDPGLVAAPTMALAGVVNAASQIQREYAERKEQAQYVSSFHSAVADTEAALSTWRQGVAASGRFMQDKSGVDVPTHEVLIESYDDIAREIRQRAADQARGLTPANAKAIEIKVGELLNAGREDAIRTRERLFSEDKVASLDDTTRMYVMSGDYFAATHMVSDYFDAGIITPAQRETRLKTIYNEMVTSVGQKVTALYEAAQAGNVSLFSQLNAEIENTVAEAVSNSVMPMSQADADVILDEAKNQGLAGLALSQFESAEDKARFVEEFNANRPESMSIEFHQQVAQKLDTMLQRSQRLEAEANAEADALAAKESARQASDLEIAVNRGQAGEPEIEALFEAGTITGAKRTQLYAELDRQTAAAQETADNIRRVDLALAHGIPMDAGLKADRDAVSAYYDQLLDSGLDPLTEEGSASTAFLARQTGVIPDSFKSIVRRGVRSSGAAEAAQVADAVRQVAENAPALMDQFDADERAFALEVSQMVAGGADPETAVTTVREGFSRPQAERDLLRKQYTAEARDNRKRLEDQIDDTFDDGFTALFRRQPDVTLALEAEYNAMAESYLMRTGNIESARLLAWEDLTRVWGVTTVNGRRELMKYPPEYAGGSRDQLRDDLTGHPYRMHIVRPGETPAPAPVEIDDFDRIRAVADSTTARDGGRTYALMQVDDNGMASPVTNSDGLPARWRPERRIDAEAQAAIERRLSEAQGARETLQARQAEARARREAGPAQREVLLRSQRASRGN